MIKQDSIDIQQVLYDFNTTLLAKGYGSETMMSKFPEFNNDKKLLQAAYDYSATLNSGKYKTIDELNSKFPEFFHNSIPSEEIEKPSLDIPKESVSVYNAPVILDTQENNRTDEMSRIPEVDLQRELSELNGKQQKADSEFKAKVDAANKSTPLVHDNSTDMAVGKILDVLRGDSYAHDEIFNKKEKQRLVALQREDAIRKTASAFSSVKENSRSISALRKQGEDNKYLDIADELNTKSMKIITAPKNYDSAVGIVNWAEGLGETLNDKDIWTSGITELVRSGNLSSIAKKLNAEEDITESESLALEAYINYGLAQEARVNDLSLGYKIGQTTAQSLPFMAEMLVTAGLGSVGKKFLVQTLVNKGKRELAEKVAKYLGGTEIKEVIGKGIGKGVAKKVEYGTTKTIGGKILKEGVETVAQTAVMPHTWVGVENDKLETILNGDEYDFLDFMRSFTDAVQETFMERAGGRMIEKGLSKVLPFEKMWNHRIAGRTVSNDIIQSPFAETGEEYLGAIMDFIRSYNPLYSDQSNSEKRAGAEEMFTGEGFAVTAGSVLPMSIFGGVSNSVKIHNTASKFRSAKSDLTNYLQQEGVNESDCRNIIRGIESSDNGIDFVNKCNIVYSQLDAQWLQQHPEASLEEAKQHQKELSAIIKNYLSKAIAYDESVQDINLRYSKLTDEERAVINDLFSKSLQKQTPPETSVEQDVKSPKPNSASEPSVSLPEGDDVSAVVSIKNTDGSVSVLPIQSFDGFEYNADGAIDLRATAEKHTASITINGEQMTLKDALSSNLISSESEAMTTKSYYDQQRAVAEQANKAEAQQRAAAEQAQQAEAAAPQIDEVPIGTNEQVFATTLEDGVVEMGESRDEQGNIVYFKSEGKANDAINKLKKKSFFSNYDFELVPVQVGTRGTGVYAEPVNVYKIAAKARQETSEVVEPEVNNEESSSSPVEETSVAYWRGEPVEMVGEAELDGRVYMRVRLGNDKEMLVTKDNLFDSGGVQLYPKEKKQKPVDYLKGIGSREADISGISEQLLSKYGAEIAEEVVRDSYTEAIDKRDNAKVALQRGDARIEAENWKLVGRAMGIELGEDLEERNKNNNFVEEKENDNGIRTTIDTENQRGIQVEDEKQRAYAERERQETKEFSEPITANTPQSDVYEDEVTSLLPKEDADNYRAAVLSSDIETLNGFYIRALNGADKTKSELDAKRAELDEAVDIIDKVLINKDLKKLEKRLINERALYTGLNNKTQEIKKQIHNGEAAVEVAPQTTPSDVRVSEPEATTLSDLRDFGRLTAAHYSEERESRYNRMAAELGEPPLKGESSFKSSYTEEKSEPVKPTTTTYYEPKNGFFFLPEEKAVSSGNSSLSVLDNALDNEDASGVRMAKKSKDNKRSGDRVYVVYDISEGVPRGYEAIDSDCEIAYRDNETAGVFSRVGDKTVLLDTSGKLVTGSLELYTDNEGTALGKSRIRSNAKKLLNADTVQASLDKQLVIGKDAQGNSIRVSISDLLTKDYEIDDEYRDAVKTELVKSVGIINSTLRRNGFDTLLDSDFSTRGKHTNTAVRQNASKRKRNSDIISAIKSSGDIEFSMGNGTLTGANELSSEEADIEREARANGTWLKAPNGAATKLTPKQWVQVRTKAFKKWFGDWELVKIYEMLDKGGLDDVSLQAIDNYLNNKYNGLRQGNRLVVSERFSPEEQQGFAKGGRLYAAASIIAGRKNSTDSAVRETQDERNDRQEADVEAYARAKGVWIENVDKTLREKYGEPIGHGQESRVYDNGDTVVKSKNTLQYYDLQGALDGIALHNSLFPETAITVTGFGKDSEGGFVIIMEQPFVTGTPLTQQEIDAYAAGLGFEKKNDGFNSRYKNSQTLLHDLHEGNVIKDADGNIFVIDNIMRFNTPEEGAGGTRVIPTADCSKVVDENGEPKVVYHQTNSVVYINRETGENWDELDWRAKQEWDERDDWDEYWEQQDFNTFSRVNARTTNELDGFFFAPEYDEYHEYGGRTIPAFLNITNPASREDYNIDSSINNAGREERIRLQNEGFDGVIREEDGMIWEYVAFEPNQIKSATDNVGTFDSENPDIRFSNDSDVSDTGMVESEVTRSVIEEARRSGVEIIDVSDEEVSEALQQSGIEPLTDTVNSVYGYAKDGKIYLTKRGLNPNTPLHEYTHLWAKMMQSANKKEWSNIVELLKGSPVWESVVNDKDYANIRTDDNKVASEVLSRLSGTHNSQRLMDEMRSAIESAKERGDIMDAVGRHNVLMRIKEALNKFWQWVGTDLFHIKFNSIEEVTDRVLYDFVSDGGTKLENKGGKASLDKAEDKKALKSLQESKKSSNFVVNITQNAGEDGKQNRLQALKKLFSRNERDRVNYKNALNTLRKEGITEAERAKAEQTIIEIQARRKAQMEALVGEALKGVDGVKLVEVSEGTGVYIAGTEVVEYTSKVSLDVENGKEKAATAVMAKLAEVLRQDSFIVNYPNEYKVGTEEVEGDGYAANVTVVADHTLTPSETAQLANAFLGKGLGVTITGNEITTSNFSDLSDKEFYDTIKQILEDYGNAKTNIQDGGGDKRISENSRMEENNGGIRGSWFSGTYGYNKSSYNGAQQNDNGNYLDRNGNETTEGRYYGKYYNSANAEENDSNDVHVQGTSVTLNDLGQRLEDTLVSTERAMSSSEQSDESSSRAGGFEFFISRKGEELDEALSIPNADERLSEAGRLYAELKNAFVHDVVDSNVYLHDLVEELNSVRKDEGAEMIPLSANPYEKASNVMSSAGGKLSIYHSDYYKPMINEVRINIDALYLGSKAPYATFEEAREAIEKYLLVKDFLERRDMGLSVEKNVSAWYKEFMEESKGVTPEAFVAKIEEYIDSDSLWERWGKLTQYLRDELYNSHLISKERYDAMNKRKYYVPQRTSEEFKDVENYTEHIIEKHKKVRRGIGTVEAIRKSNGTNLEAANPLEWIDFIAQNTFMQSSINEAKVSFLELFNNEHDASVLKSKGISVRSAYVYTDSNKNGIPNIEEIEKYEEYSRYIEDVNNKKHPTEHEEEVRDRATTLRDALGIKGGYVSKGVGSNEVVVAYGNRVFVIDAGNAKLAHSLNHELSREEMSKLLKVCRKLNRLSASVLTTLNPVFAPKNFIRDVKFTIAAAFIEDPMLAARITKNLAHPNLGAISEYLWNGDFLETEDGKMFKQFISDGGSGGYTMSMDGKVNIKKRIDEELRDDMTINSAKNNVLKGLSFLSNSSELIVRYNIYRSALENGETRERALHLSKNLNVNFDIRGSHDSLFSSILFNNVLFANASVRAIVGGYRALKNGTKSPAAIARLAGVVGFQLLKGYSSVMLMDYYARILSESLLGGDDDDKIAREEYYKTIINYLTMLNNFDRYSYSNYTKLPLAMFTGNKDSGTLKQIEEQRLAIFSNIGASLAYYSLGYANWGDTSHKLIDDIMGAILPFELSTNMESNWELLSPYRVLKAFLGNIDIGNQDEAHYLNAKYNTDELSQGCSRVLFNMFYGEDDKGKRFGDSRRGLELKPEWFKASSNLVLPSFVRNIGYLALAPMAGIQLKVTDIPFVNSLYEEQGKMLERNQYKVVSDFGNKIYKLKSDLAEIDKLDDLGKDNLAYEKMDETYTAIRDYKIALLYAESALDEYKGYDVRRQAINNQQFMDEFLQGKPKGYAEEQAKFQRSCFFNKLLPSIIRVQDGLKVNDYFDDTNPLLK